MNAENHNLSDEEILAQMRADADEDLPDAEGGEEVDELEKKRRHAFAQKKRTSKDAVAFAEKMKKENEELKAERENKATQKPPASTSADQATQVLQQLTYDAMNKLGITEINENNRELVRMERDRLYSTKMNQVEERAQVEHTAAETVNSELAKIDQLEDGDILEVKKRLNDLDVLQRVKSSNIRQVVSQYLGEKVMGGTLGATGTNGKPPSSQESTAATGSAINSVKNGRSGVGAVPGSGQGKQDDETPATLEEAINMRKLNLHDVKAYRRALKHKVKYKGR